ncbi:MAG: hypothetical protein C4K49_10975 [Candidatus Thorarchaeota archaeon]|nr:MAG: hypothetical protein C4K49_10975 [Candidatus Thorarchaeota archaeon]
MDEMWAARVVRGKKIIIEKTMSELGLDNFVGVIYGHIRIEGLSRHDVAMCAGRLMQYARKYQQSGVCPNFELPDLVREGEEPPVHTHTVGTVVETQPAQTISTVTEPESAQAVPGMAALEQLPELKLLSPKDSWRSEIEAHSVLLTAAAMHCGGLQPGQHDALFAKTADELVSLWSESGNSADLVVHFASMIQACSKESQLPKTGSGRITVETGSCEILRMANRLDKSGTRLPKGYPCKFHEMIAGRVGDRAGVDVAINTSSVGCIVTIALKQ